MAKIGKLRHIVNSFSQLSPKTVLTRLTESGCEIIATKRFSGVVAKSRRSKEPKTKTVAKSRNSALCYGFDFAQFSYNLLTILLYTEQLSGS